MLTRAMTLDTYKVDGDGYITTRGRFYKERIFVPHFWDKTVKAKRVIYDKTPDGLSWAIWKVVPWDLVEYPELRNIGSIGVREEAGKVLSWTRASSYVEPCSGRRI